MHTDDPTKTAPGTQPHPILSPEKPDTWSCSRKSKSPPLFTVSSDQSTLNMLLPCVVKTYPDCSQPATCHMGPAALPPRPRHLEGEVAPSWPLSHAQHSPRGAVSVTMGKVREAGGLGQTRPGTALTRPGINGNRTMSCPRLEIKTR
ncbi:hypothetical protein LX36DRAFT_313344 [Colletotrichum falcatum]|nr:hypothetical protein LX36DRAFT_313344 [Colletotrichum falcatum]